MSETSAFLNDTCKRKNEITSTNGTCVTEKRRLALLWRSIRKIPEDVYSQHFEISSIQLYPATVRYVAQPDLMSPHILNWKGEKLASANMLPTLRYDSVTWIRRKGRGSSCQNTDVPSTWPLIYGPEWPMTKFPDVLCSRWVAFLKANLINVSIHSSALKSWLCYPVWHWKKCLSSKSGSRNVRCHSLLILLSHFPATIRMTSWKNFHYVKGCLWISLV